jgi:hypothetical protein
MRNFICPETEAACERGECKKGVLCIIENEDAARRAPGSAHYWGEFNKADVDREMWKLATEDVEHAYRAKYRKKIDPETLRNLRNKNLETRHADYAKRARRILHMIKSASRIFGSEKYKTKGETAKPQKICEVPERDEGAPGDGAGKKGWGRDGLAARRRD